MRLPCLVSPLLASIFALAAARLSGADELPLLTSAEEVRRLNPQEAAKGYPVKLRGVITFRAPGWPFAFVQDETGGLFVPGPYPQEAGGDVLRRGLFVEIEGRTVPGRFAPFVRGLGAAPLRITALGIRSMPAPKPLAPEELGDPRNHSLFVEIKGMVRALAIESPPNSRQQVAAIGVGASEGRTLAVVFGEELAREAPAGFIGSSVLVRGVFGSLFDSKRQFLGMRLCVNGFKEFRILHAGPREPFEELPARPIGSLLQFSSDESQAGLARVHGIVTLTVPGRGVFLEAGGRGVLAETSSEPFVGIGDVADAIGFPARGEWSPVLQDAQLRRQGRGALPEAPVIDEGAAMSGDFDSRRVRLRAALLDVSRPGEPPALVLQSGGRVFTARGVGSAADMPRWRAGSTLEITGVCLNERGPSPRATALASGDAQVSPPPVGFELAVAMPAGVKLLREASWWTRGRVSGSAAALSALAVAALAWGAALRRRVAAQTRIIRDQVGRESVHEERIRLSRELHDTLEQELMGVSLQLDAAADKLPTAPAKAQQALTSAQALLKHTRDEVRRSIWDLRAAALENAGLAEAVRMALRQLEDVDAPGIEVEVAGIERRLPAKAEMNLLRIATEAVANAVKHARARRITVALTFAADETQLSVADDGVGFIPARAATAADGHFGLLGMRERAAALGAAFELRSAPGAGTQVLVRVAAQKHNGFHQ